MLSFQNIIIYIYTHTHTDIENPVLKSQLWQDLDFVSLPDILDCFQDILGIGQVSKFSGPILVEYSLFPWSNDEGGAQDGSLPLCVPFDP